MCEHTVCMKKKKPKTPFLYRTLLATYLIEGALNALAGVASNISECPAESTQAVVGFVASPIHQMCIRLFAYCQIKTATKHLFRKL